MVEKCIEKIRTKKDKAVIIIHLLFLLFISLSKLLIKINLKMHSNKLKTDLNINNEIRLEYLKNRLLYHSY